MRNTKQSMSRLLMVAADALESMSNREFDQLMRGEGNLRFVPKSKAEKKPNTDIDLKSVATEFAQQLSEAESREVAEGLLASVHQPKRKAFLLLVAKESRVRVGSKDTILEIEHKLVENTVGAKLRSKALQPH